MNYYNSKLGLGCKDLRKNKKDDQLAEHQDIELYLLLYISNDHKE